MHHNNPQHASLAFTETAQRIRLLQHYAPYDQMDQAHLLYLVDHSSLQAFAANTMLLNPDSGPVRQCYLILDGIIEGVRHSTSGPTESFRLTVGDLFPIAAIIGERPTRTLYASVAEAHCLVLDSAHLVYLLQHSEPFRLYMLEGVSSLLGQLKEQIRLTATQQLGAERSLNTPLQQLLTRDPAVCRSNTSLIEAVQQMHEQNVSSVAITDSELRLEGIFTLRDLRRIFADAHIERHEPVGQFMTEAPFSLRPQDTAFDAALLMTKHHIGHVCIVEDGCLLGVLSERDLFALQRVDLVRLSRALRYAESIEELQHIRGNIVQLVSNMLANGANAPQVTGLITQLNDHTTARIIELMLAKQPQPLPRFCWLSFGSEGRHEQSILTDQDNGILFYTDAQFTAKEARRRLLPLAEQVNQALDQCGLVHCPGNIMASNPELCLSENEWQRKFGVIIRTPDPENLLRASIFFDIRGLWGDRSALQRILPAMLHQISDHPPFQRLMATNALQYRLPLHNPLRQLGTVFGIKTKYIDLKAEALSPFVDAARILALAYGISDASTLERLRLLGERKALDHNDVQAFQDAYSYLQLLRLELHLQQTQAQKKLSNRLPLHSLNPLERRILRESVKQAKRLQDILRFKYQL